MNERRKKEGVMACAEIVDFTITGMLRVSSHGGGKPGMVIERERVKREDSMSWKELQESIGRR